MYQFNSHTRTFESIPYPKGVFFIYFHTFLDRFSFYSIRGIMALYFTNILEYEEPVAKSIYHCALGCVYFSPFVGGLIADSWLGKFKTIFWIGLLYITGVALLSLSSIDPLKLPKGPLTVFAFIITACGTGGIKACQSALGGDQFILPQQDTESKRFLSILYVFINVGMFCAYFLSPYLKTEITCFERTSCYPLSFGTALGLIVLSMMIFTLGRPFYRIHKPTENVLFNVTKCITHAIFHKRHSPPVDHWLDRSEPEFGRQIVSDIKALMKIMLLFLPLPFFSALYDQQGSGWIFLATRMDGAVGEHYTIIPDQMQIFNPIVSAILIPLFSYGIYPLFKKCNFLTTPLKRMVTGGMLASVAYLMSAGLAMVVEETFSVLPEKGEIQLRMYDVTDCEYTFTSSYINLPKGQVINGYYENNHVSINVNSLQVNFTFNSRNHNCEIRHYSLDLTDQLAYGIYIKKDKISHFLDSVNKTRTGFPRVRTMISGNVNYLTYTHTKYGKDITVVDAVLEKMPYAGYHLISGFHGREVKFKQGGTYTVLAKKDAQLVRLIVVSKPNSIHMLWLVPQYVILTVAEILFYITGWEFAYAESPSSMKAVVTACFLLTSAFGNIIIVIIETIGRFEKQSHDFFLYAGMMVITVLVFMVLSMRYKYENEAYFYAGTELGEHSARESRTQSILVI